MMKKYYTLILLCFVGIATSNAQFINIPDPNFEQALIDLGLDMAPIDGQADMAMLASVQTLDVSGRNIFDLSGIRGFIQLQTLNATNNNLNIISELVELSQLINLDVSNNNLQLLVLDQNSNLQSLNVSNNSLINLDLLQLSSLKTLNANGNSLSSISLASNTLLETLIIDNNQLVDLNVNQNTALITLSANGNEISSIDLTQNTALKVIRLENNSITNANLKNGNNTELVGFDLTGNPDLDCVFVDSASQMNQTWGNQIDSGARFEDGDYCEYTPIPDVAFEKTLEALGYDDVSEDGRVPTTLIEGVENLDLNNPAYHITNLTGIADFAALETLIASNNSIIFADFSDNLALKEINLESNPLTGINLSSNTNLEIIDLDNTHLSTIDISSNSALTSFSITNTGLNSINISANNALETLRITGNSISEINFGTTTDIINLYVGNNEISELDLSSFSFLENIEVDGNNLTSLSIKNGNNSIINTFDATGNSSLSCILIDDMANIGTNWIIDQGTTYSDTYCLYTSIPDSNFEAALLSYDDNPDDGRVPTELIKGITVLDLRNRSISDLTGIEDFTALERLLASDNVLKIIDLSKNTALRNLSLSNNSLESIDVSRNTQLTNLSISNNSLTNLDLSNNTLLQQVIAMDNEITSLNTTNCDVLSELNVNNNDLTSVDLSTNVRLGEIYIENNELVSIDLSLNVDLSELYLRENLIAAIDLSKNTNLREAYIDTNGLESLTITENTILEILSVKNNNLTSLDLRNGANNVLDQLDTTGNNDLRCILIDDALNPNPNWVVDTEVIGFSSTYCRYTTIPDANFEAALFALNYDDIEIDGQVPTELIEGITTLNLSDNSISDLTGIEDFTLLERLFAEDNLLTTIDLSKNTALQRLSLSNNSLESIDISKNTQLTNLFIGNNNLTTLDLSNNTLLQLVIAEDNEITSLNTTNCDILSEINVDNNDLTSIDLSTNVGLSEIHIENNELPSIELYLNVNLLELYLRENLITAIDLSKNTNLLEAYIDTNDLESLAITENTILEILSVKNNNLTSLDLRNGANDVLEQLDTTGNDDLKCIFIDDALNPNTDWVVDTEVIGFSSTYCRYTSIPDSNFETALGALMYDDIADDGQVPTELIEGVISLSVSGRSISDLTGIEDFVALKSLFAANNALETINLSENTEIESLSLANNSLISLDLSNNLKLTDVIVSDNDLESLNTNNLAALEDLDARENELASIDLSTNTALIDLHLEGNLLTTINLSQNTALYEINLEGNNLERLELTTNTSLNGVFAGYNNLRFFDLRNGANNFIEDLVTAGNTSLSCILVDDASSLPVGWQLETDTVLSESYCRYTSVPDSNFETALHTLGYDDISEDGQVPTALIEEVSSLPLPNSLITNLTGIEDFTALENIFIGDATITTIDLTANTSLITLNFENCEINNLILDDNPLLEVLEFQSTNEEKSSINALDLSSNSLLRIIEVNDVELESITLPIELPNLEILFLAGNKFTSLDLSAFSALKRISLGNNALLEYLDLRNGNNTNILSANLDNNPNLSCILVDDATYSTTNWTNIDNQTSFSDTYCRYTSVPNSIFEGYLYALGYDDIQNDGQVPTALIEKVTLLDLADRGITNIIGIEDFVGLTNLNLKGNDFDTIDLSNNTFLESFNCNSCTSLESINISGLTVLKELKLGNTQITEVDLGSLSLLESLNVRESEIAAIDVSRNTNLNTLNISSTDIGFLDLSTNNGLTKLTAFEANLNYLNLQNTNIINIDVRGNPGLSCILIDDASAIPDGWDYDNTVTFSDTYCRYTAIPDANFEAALGALMYDDIASDGQVPTALIEVVNVLSVGNSNISDLTGIEDFTALTSLYCHDNSIQNLDLRNNSLLEFIKCDDNNMDVLHLEGLASFEELVGFGNDFTSFDFSTVPSLRKISLFSNELTTLDVSNNPNLEFIRIDNNDLTSLNVNNGNNTNISFLDIRQNPNLYCVQVDDIDYANTNFTDKDDQTSFSENCESLEVDLTVILEGAFELSGPMIMRDDLNDNDLLPTTSPYSDAISGNPASILGPPPATIVDWVEIQLRNPNDINDILYRQSAFLQRGGNIVTVDDQSTPEFSAWRGNYYVAVAHRNHLTLTSSTTHLLNGSGPEGFSLDLTDVSNILGGINAVNDMGDGYYAMHAGDYDGNGQIQNADINSVIQQLGSSGYNNADLDMNGQVQNTDINNVLNPNIGKGEQF